MRRSLLLLLALALPAFAQDAGRETAGQFMQQGQLVRIFRIGEVRAPLAQLRSMDAFALRVGRDLRAYTLEHGVEACAVLCAGKKEWAATLVTIESQAACPRLPACPKGTRATATDIHSHLAADTFRALALDQLFLPADTAVGALIGTRPEHFSAADLAGGQGYLVSPGKTQYQRDGVVRVVPEGRP